MRSWWQWWLLKWLSKQTDKLHFNVAKVLQSNTETIRKKRKNFEICQAMAWLEHSVVTVDRQNGTDQVKMRKIGFLRKYKDLYCHHKEAFHLRFDARYKLNWLKSVLKYDKVQLTWNLFMRRSQLKEKKKAVCVSLA